MRTAAVLLVLALLALPSTADATKAANGKFLNGKFLNGKFLNTAVMDATPIGTSAAFKPFKYGAEITDVHVRGNGLGGWVWNGQSYDLREGEFWEGLYLAGKHASADGSSAEMKYLYVQEIHPAETNSDVLLHYVLVWENSAWQPLCGKYSEYGPAVPAIVLRGEWSEESGAEWGGDQISDSAYKVTFACATGALGKCAAECYAGNGKCGEIPMDLGYRRWVPPGAQFVGWSPTTGWQFVWRDFAMDHQACTRMVRADYCGDGRPMTEDGTQIDVYDATSLNTMSETPGTTLWDYEAQWSEDGAYQVSCKRDGGYIINCTPPGQLYNSAYTLPVMCYGSAIPAPARIANLRYKPLVLPIRF